MTWKTQLIINNDMDNTIDNKHMTWKTQLIINNDMEDTIDNRQ